ncbi:uncharacterized protein LOC142985250 [Anticarsia gemmatalis]|uniref:uncharacterized protein LOC142985250 n=1 Tax=Anticarsia gemmatalis TaxID=129554 RepID=UPI003F7643FC
MDKPSFKLVGAPCGQHGQYTFYKALRLTGATDRIIAIGDFFFVRIWQDSELVSIGELQLLWTDRVSDQTLVSLRLYFLPENTPEGRNLHGEDEVLAINDKVVLRADDLLSWICTGAEWRWGLRAVWRGACAPPADPRHTSPLHHTKLDFSDVDTEKNAIAVDADAPGVVVFSYPRYCRYRALLARLEGIQADWLRDSLVAALGGYAAPTNNTRILYCKDTFEYPELEGHEFVCNHLAPRLKGRPRGRRRRAPHSPSPDRSDRSATESPPALSPPTPRRLSLRNGGPDRHSDDEEDCRRGEDSAEDRAFLQHLKQFYKNKNEPLKSGYTLKDLSLRSLYVWVVSRGGYEAVCRHKLWRALTHDQPARTRRHYERFLLPYENHERRNGTPFFKLNGKIEPEPQTIATIDVTDSPLRETTPEKILRTPSPKLEKDPEKVEIILKNAEELNREFLDSLPKEDKLAKISVKPVEKLIEPNMVKLYEDGRESKEEVKDLTQNAFLNDVNKIGMGDPSRAAPAPLNGHAALPPVDLKSRPAGRSSLRAVRVKPARAPLAAPNTPPNPLRPDSASSSPPLSITSCPPPAPPSLGAPPITNFGIHHPPPPTQAHSDDDIVEVPYKPKTPEIIDLDEYPESPQAVKKKKLDILKERGLEVTALPPWNPMQPIINPPMIINPAMQHQIMTQAQLFQMYNIIPPNYANGYSPPKVIQASSAFGNAGPEKTVYGNPKDPFMPPPHILHGAPVKPLRTPPATTPQDILDLTCKSTSPPLQPAVEILRVSSPKSTAQNLTKNYTLIDGKAVVGSNLEITLVNKAHSPTKTGPRPPQKRSSNGKFMSSKTSTPPKDFAKFPPPTHTNVQKKPAINIPNYQIRENSPTSSQKPQFKAQNVPLPQIMDLQKGSPPVNSFIDPYTVALYSSLANQMDQRQLAMYRELMANQFRGYPGLLNLGVSNTPTTKN